MPLVSQSVNGLREYNDCTLDMACYLSYLSFPSFLLFEDLSKAKLSCQITELLFSQEESIGKGL